MIQPIQELEVGVERCEGRKGQAELYCQIAVQRAEPSKPCWRMGEAQCGGLFNSPANRRKDEFEPGCL